MSSLLSLSVTPSFDSLPSCFHHDALPFLFSKALDFIPYRHLCPMELHLVLTDGNKIRSYNALYRNQDKETDILAFPTTSPGEEWIMLPHTSLFIGDLMINLPYVMEQARDDKKVYESHLAHLLIHGFLHLFHYDHHTPHEAHVMESLETLILCSQGWPDPHGDTSSYDNLF